MSEFLKLHDTHGHLDLLLEKLGLIKLEEGSMRGVEVLDKNWEKETENLLLNHEFFTQATISAGNYNNLQELFKNQEKIHFLIGSHPEIVDENFDVREYLNNQENILKDIDLKKSENRIVGIGEIGLDYYYTDNEVIKTKQKELFKSQIELAVRNDFSIQIHSRNAFKDTFDVIKDYPDIHGKFSFHCFTESVEELKQILDLGGYIGVGGISTYKNAVSVIESVKYCPMENFMLETDLPFLAPPPFRGKDCLPNMIQIIGKNLADLKGVSEYEIWKNSKDNFERLFNYKINTENKK